MEFQGTFDTIINIIHQVSKLRLLMIRGITNSLCVGGGGGGAYNTATHTFWASILYNISFLTIYFHFFQENKHVQIKIFKKTVRIHRNGNTRKQ